MALEGTGKIHEQVKGRIMIYIPAAVHRDSQFPFEPKENVNIRIDGKRIIIEKIE
jgi:hypothetical protein